MHKGTNIISEINSFFTEKRQVELIPALSTVIEGLHLDKRVFGGKKRHNCKMTYYQTLQLILMLPFFAVNGFSHYAESILHSSFRCEKDMFYSFMSKDDINWRNILCRFAVKLIDRISVRADHKKSDLPRVLIVDDTDLPKTGIHIEMTGKISKGEMLIEMVKRAVSYGLGFDYLLVDSWFTNTALVDFVCSSHKQFHLLGMGKLGNTKYHTEWGDLTAKSLIAKFDKPKVRKTSRALHCQYFQVDAKLGGRDVRLFFCRMSKHQRWRLLVTTDLSLDFARAYRIYAMRWGIEVFYSDSKKYLNLAGCESTNFNQQLAHVSVACMQYAIMSFVKRAYDYDTIGGLFRQTYLGVEDIVVVDKIWAAILEAVTILAEEYGMTEETIISKIIADHRKLSVFKSLADYGIDYNALDSIIETGGMTNEEYKEKVRNFVCSL